MILLVDDMGWGDPGVYGGGVAVGAPTPAIDRMATEGLKLTSTYSQPTCTPTRAALMTGRTPPRSGLTRPILTGEAVETSSTGHARFEWGIPQVLQKAGRHLATFVSYPPKDIGLAKP